MKMMLASAFVFVLVATSSVSAYPWHASCRVDWTVGLPCSDAKTALKNQMEAWTTKDNCANGGQRCLYKYLSDTETTLEGTHETPVKHYIDDLKFTFQANGVGSCNVQGYSTSQLWYAVLDYGTNYCNIRNLMDGAKLHESSDFSESTRDSVCTQYTSRNCDVY